MRHLMKSLSVVALVALSGAGVASAQDSGREPRIERGGREEGQNRRERHQERREARERDGTGSVERGDRGDRRDRADREDRFDRNERRDRVVIRESERARPGIVIRDNRPNIVVRDRFVAPLVVRPRVRTVCRIEVRERFNTANGVLRRRPVEICREVASRRVVSTRIVVR